MPDAQDAAWQLWQRRHADQTRRRLTRIFDADGDGLSDSTLPMFGSRTEGRQGPPPSPISLPVGESITVDVPPQEIPVGGKFLELGAPVSGPVRAGFGGYTGSGTGMPASVTAYYAAALSGMWEEAWEDGSRIEWWVGGQLIGQYRGPNRWRTLEREERRVGVVGRGTLMRLFVDHEDSVAHDWNGGTAWFDLVDTPGLEVGDPEPETPPPPEFGGAVYSQSTGVPYPDGTSEGDRLVAFAVREHSTGDPSIPTPSGWTLLNSHQGSSGFVRIRIHAFTRIVGGESSVTFPSGTGTNFHAIVARADPETAPVSTAVRGGPNTATSRALDFSGFTMVAGFAMRSSGTAAAPTITSPSGATLRLDGTDASNARRGRLWSSDADGDTIAIEAPERLAIGGVTWGDG